MRVPLLSHGMYHQLKYQWPSQNGLHINVGAFRISLYLFIPEIN